jgi:hypothetical protein
MGCGGDMMVPWTRSSKEEGACVRRCVLTTAMAGGFGGAAASPGLATEGHEELDLLPW